MEKNRLIAEFMGGKYSEYPDGFFPGEFGYRFDKDNWWNINALAYDTKWDWLMPVVEKIGDLRIKSSASYNPDLSFRIEIVNGYTKIEGTGKRIFANSSIEGSMLLATHKAIIQFIEWYNTQNKK